MRRGRIPRRGRAAHELPYQFVEKRSEDDQLLGARRAGATITSGNSTTLGFTLTNPATNTVPMTGVTFTDTLTGGLGVATGVSSVCGGTLTTTTTSITLTGATIPLAGQCTFNVPVINAPIGTFVNTTGTIFAANGGTGNSASATLLVVAQPLIPTLSPWMIGLLAATLLLATFLYARRRGR